VAKKKAEFTDDDDALLDELGVEAEAEVASTYTPRQERILAGFEEVQRFFTEHGRLPMHGADRDIFERLYAVRLDRIRESAECLAFLAGLDSQGLLAGAVAADSGPLAEASDDDVLAALGVDRLADDVADVTRLEHVRPRAEVKAAEEVAQRTPCPNFAAYKATFEQVQRELDAKTRKTVKHHDDFDPVPGDLFIVAGQKVLIAEVGPKFTTEYDRTDRRLRVIYDNATESDLLLRSLQRALQRDPAGRQILPPATKGMPLFADQIDAEDAESGTVYVVRSLSTHPFIAEHRELIHKIGVTGQDVKKRLAGVKKDPTFLMADVELVGSYKLANINRNKLEGLLHTFFADARIDLELTDRFAEKVEPREWFLVPLQSIEKAMELLASGAIQDCAYDRASAAILVRATGEPL
jgi:hypothetical protein